MEVKYLIGVDIGTSLVKSGVYDTKGRCLSTAIRRAPEENPKPGLYIQSGEEFFSTVQHVIKDAVEQSKVSPKKVEAIGFSGQMGGAIGVDEEWNPLTDWSNGLDTRYLPYVMKMLSKNREDILTYAGTNYPYFTPKLLWWKTEFPELYKKVRKFLILSGYIAGRMSDTPVEEAFMDHTFMQMTGIADIPRVAWRMELVDEFDLSSEKLPRIVLSNERVGTLNKNVAERVGLISGIPLVSGAGDKPAGFLAAGMVEPGKLIDEASSFTAFTCCVDEFVPDRACRTLEIIPSPIKGHYFPTLILIGSGTTHRWFVETFSHKSSEGASMEYDDVFTSLDEKAALVDPGSNKLINIGLLGGRGYPPDPDVRGTWIGISFGHKKEHFYRSILEGFAYEYALALDAMRRNYPNLNFKDIRVIGGGSKSDLWNQIKSDVLNLPFVRLARDDFTLLGDTLLAGSGVGIYPDLKDISENFVRETESYSPNQQKHHYYRQYVELYRSLFPQFRTAFTDIQKLPDYEPDSK